MKAPVKVRRVIILGALSAIAEATARLFARNGARLVLAARDQGRLNEIADDLVVRGAAQVHTAAIDCPAEPDPQRRMHDFIAAAQAMS
jgi:short-subunit dehydrogenase